MQSIRDLEIWSILSINVGLNKDGVMNAMDMMAGKKVYTLEEAFIKEVENEKNIMEKYRKVVNYIFPGTDPIKLAFERNLVVKENYYFKDKQKYSYEELKDNYYLVEWVKENPKNKYDLKLNKDGVLSYGRSHKDFINKVVSFIKDAPIELIYKMYLEWEKHDFVERRIQTEIVKEFLNNYGTKRDYPIEIIKAIYDFNVKGTTGKKEVDSELEKTNNYLLEDMKEYGKNIQTYFFEIRDALLLDELDGKKFNEVPNVGVYVEFRYCTFYKGKKGYFIKVLEKDKNEVYDVKLDLENLTDEYSDMRLVVEYNKERKERGEW